MKVQYIIATHGHMASGIHNSIEILLGNKENIYSIDCYVDDKDVEKEIKDITEIKYPNEDILIFTDLYGGSVNQIATRIANDRIHVVTGINLALVLELITLDKITPEDINAAIEGAKSQIVYINDITIENDDEFF